MKKLLYSPLLSTNQIMGFSVTPFQVTATLFMCFAPTSEETGVIEDGCGLLFARLVQTTGD
jgi:hypothetical protein